MFTTRDMMNSLITDKEIEQEIMDRLAVEIAKGALENKDPAQLIPELEEILKDFEYEGSSL